jgi:hypothetical protein
VNVKDKWWYRLGTLTLTVGSAVELFKAAGIRPLTGPSASVASWVIFLVCTYGLAQIFEIIFAFVVSMVERSRQADGKA